MTGNEEIDGQQIEIYDMAGLFILLASGVGLALLVLVGEFIAASYIDTVLDQKQGVRTKQ